MGEDISGLLGCSRFRIAHEKNFTPGASNIKKRCIQIIYIKNMANLTEMAKIDAEEKTQEKLLDLHNKIIELEKLEILRKRAKTKSLKINDVYDNFFNQSSDCTVIIQDRQIIFLSPPLARLLGYTQEEMLNTPFACYVHPDELPRLAKYYLLRMTGENAPPLYNTIVKHRDGTDIPIEVRAGIIPYQGKVADFIIVKKLGDEQDK